jgi:pyruvate dehydrogenase E2 component (dihydrolipoamide acetyltransferase)
VTVTKLGMPKWGLQMREGALVAWLVEEGATVARGDPIAEVETEKINGVVESPADGVLRRRVAQVGDVVPVGGLIGVLGDADTADADVDAFVAEFQATFVPEDEADEGGPQPETVTVGGQTTRYLRHGEDGDAVVLLHGFGGDLATWLFNQEALAAGGRSVYALDLPGHGGSTKQVGAGTAEALAATVAEALDAMGVGRAHVAGHSLGGAVAIALGTASPDRVASLTLIAPAGLGPEIDGEFVDGFVAAEGRRELKPLLERLFADPEVVTRDFVEEVLRFKRLDGVDEALRAIAGACFPAGRQAVDLAATLAGLGVPVLCIWGSEDRIVPASHAGALPPGAETHVLAGAGHMPQMEVAGEVNRLVAAFLDSVPS